MERVGLILSVRKMGAVMLTTKRGYEMPTIEIQGVRV